MTLLAFFVASLVSLVAGQAGTDLVVTLLSSQALSNDSAWSRYEIEYAAEIDLVHDVVFLAPSDAALQNYRGSFSGVLPYSTLNASSLGFLRRGNITQTGLDDAYYTNVTGGQVIQAYRRNGINVFRSGFAQESTVVAGPYEYNYGYIMVVDRVPQIPENFTSNMLAFNLTAALGATQGDHDNVEQALNTLPDLTIFAPVNDAFRAVGSAINKLTTEQVSQMMMYHVIRGNVLYSQDFEASQRTNYTTLKNESLSIYVDPTRNNSVFVNGARIISSDILLSNGVLHVIDNVLNPDNATDNYDRLAGSANGTPMFSAASSLSTVPFTTGVPTPTSALTFPAFSTVSGGSQFTLAPGPVTSTIPHSSSEKHGLSGGAIAGIVIGSIVGIVAIAVLALFLFRKRLSKPQSLFRRSTLSTGTTVYGDRNSYDNKGYEMFSKGRDAQVEDLGNQPMSPPPTHRNNV